MIVRDTCPRCGVKEAHELAVTLEQISKWMDGALIQDAMPGLDTSEREFIKTGLCRTCQSELFD